MALEAIYTVAGTVLFLTWVVYPILISCLRIGRGVSAAGSVRAADAERVTVLVAAWNAEKSIGARVRNLAEQTMPRNLLRIFIASDGSSDRTVQQAQSACEGDAPEIVVKQYPRGGKSATQNLAISEIEDRIVVLSDADTVFAPDCIERLIAPFSRPEVGCVTGTMISRDESETMSKDQGLYWRFENWLRLCESDCGTLAMTAGACMAFRKELFVPLAHSRGDDCMIPLDVALAGYRVVHVPDALAYDIFPSTIRGEMKARKRMTARNIAGILDRGELLNPFRHPGYAMSLWFHKIFRWLTPFFAAALLFASCSLATRHPVALALQLLFLLLAGVGGLFAVLDRQAPRLAAAAFSFLIANLGFALGMAKWLFGKEIITYENIQRSVAPPEPGRLQPD
jgi:cellulose synthase/poly-beta-1,6-N-acetylglucosamine synthase-like glycosyltransferase